jgi:hypothetical protein
MLSMPLHAPLVLQIIFGSAEPLESYSAHLLLSKDEVYFTVLETKGSLSIYGPRPSSQVDVLISGVDCRVA